MVLRSFTTSRLAEDQSTVSLKDSLRKTLLSILDHETLVSANAIDALNILSQRSLLDTFYSVILQPDSSVFERISTFPETEDCIPERFSAASHAESKAIVEEVGWCLEDSYANLFNAICCTMDSLVKLVERKLSKNSRRQFLMKHDVLSMRTDVVQAGANSICPAYGPFKPREDWFDPQETDITHSWVALCGAESVAFDAAVARVAMWVVRDAGLPTRPAHGEEISKVM
jgi:hypothetical protein